LPLPPGGVLCVPLHARIFTPRNWCEVELAYCGAAGGGAAGAAATGGGGAAGGGAAGAAAGGGGAAGAAVAAVRAGWHRRAALSLSLPRVRPGPTARR